MSQTLNDKIPGLFVSHGTFFEALHLNPTTQFFQSFPDQFLINNKPEGVVVISAHWETEVVKVTGSSRLKPLKEGFEVEFYRPKYEPAGSPVLAERVVTLLRGAGLKVAIDTERGLDHGAIIPLRWMFGKTEIPIVQLSLQQKLDPRYHYELGQILAQLQHENVLLLGSGGSVHNTAQIQRFGGYDLPPDEWARQFDEILSQIIVSKAGTERQNKLFELYNTPLFKQAHPRSEHFIPLIVLAGSAGNEPGYKVHESFQWKNLSMSAFLFTD